MRSCMCSLFIQRLGTSEGGRVQLVYESTCCLVWGVISDSRRDRGVVCVCFISNAGGSVGGCMCVYTHAQTHTAQMGYLAVSPGVVMRHLEGPKNPTKSRHICIRTCVQSTHVYVYARRPDEILN